MRLLALALFTWGLGEGLFIYIQSLYLSELGADPQTIGGVLAAAALAAGLAHVPAGMLADRLGRKPLLLAGWMVAFGSGAVMFVARDLAVFVPALVAYNFTTFIIAPLNAYAAAARGTASVQRAISFTSASFWAGTIISPAVGGLIAAVSELRMVFGAATVVFVVSTGVLALIRPQPREALLSGQSRYGGLLRNRRFLGFLALMFAAMFAMQVGMPFMPNFAAEVRGLDVGLVSLLGSANSLGTVGFNLYFGQRLPRRAFMLAQGLMAASLGLLLVAGGYWLFLAYFLRAGWYLAHNMSAAQVGRVVAPAEMGLAFGLTETVAAAATVVGPLLAGVLYARAPALPFQVSLALVVLTLPLVWRFAPRRDAHTPVPPPEAVLEPHVGD
ncbi:MAG: MFS transporter [Anaerolineales bacterium]|nr:MFS transporter [Anaerolineales bacterium]